MIQNISQQPHSKTTIGTLISAFLLLSVTVAASVWYVLRSARDMSRVTQTEAMVTKQRKAIDHLLTHLLNASTQGATVTLKYANNAELTRYLQASAQVDTALAELKTVVADSMQRQRVDSLQTLVWLKRDGTVRLVNALRRENHVGSNLQQQIEALHRNNRPVTMKIEIPVVERGEQVVIQRRKRGFFRRLGDAFRRAKDDTIHSSVVQHESVKDTAQRQIDIADTLAHMLTDVHRDMQRDSLSHVQRIFHRSDELRAASLVLTHRITALIDNFTSAQQQLISQAFDKERLQRRNAAFRLGGMASLAILLSGLLLIWLWRDIRRANRYRKALEQAKERSERLMTQRERLLLTISHDIKAPVNTILGYLKLLPYKVKNQHSELQAVETSAQHLLHLVMALLDYHKLEAGGIAVKKSSMEMHLLLHDVVEAFHPLAQQKNLSLHAAVAIPSPLWVLTDALRLRQIIENLLSNAIKYTMQGGITLRADWDDALHQLRLCVEDTGCGMTQADLDRIFMPFIRVKGSEGQEGAGLGLSITRQLVALLGGTLEAHSELGHGSRFVLTLPLQKCQPPSVHHQAEAEKTDIIVQNKELASPLAHEVPQESNSPILCVVLDDDSLQLQLTEAMLHNVLPEHSVVESFTGVGRMLKWLDEGHCPAFILTDIEMPESSGYEVLNSLRNRDYLAQVPVVAMTSHLLVPVVDFKQRGFADVLFKPFTQNDIIRVFTHHRDFIATEKPTLQSGPLAALTAFAEGDAQAEETILRQFASDCRAHLQLLEKAVAHHDKSAACRVAHKMLPTFTLIGSPVLSALQTLEKNRADGLWQDNDATLCQQIIEQLRQLIVEPLLNNKS